MITSSIISICCLISFAQAIEPNILNNGLAQSTFEHLPIHTETKPLCEISGSPLNLLIILDSSGSLREKFEEERDVVRDIIGTVAVHPDYTRIALIQYSGIARTEFDFNRFNSTNHVLNQRNAIAHVNNLRFINGVTRTGHALQYALHVLEPEKGWRPSVETIAFVVSDGRTYDKIKNLDEIAAGQLRTRGADIYAYGTGEYVAMEQLVDITGSDQKVFSKSKQDYVKLHYNDMLQRFSEYSPNEKCIEVPACVPGSDKPLDLMFVLDGSGSLESRFNEETMFVHKVIQKMNIHPQAVQLAVIQYARRARSEFQFRDYQTRGMVEVALRNIHYMSGTTRTNNALKVATHQLRTDPGRRQGVPSVVVILTDGHSINTIGQNSDVLLREADYVYAVAVSDTKLVDSYELNQITKNWKNVFMRNNLTEFERVLSNHFSYSCPGIQGESVAHFEPISRGPVEVSCTLSDVSVNVRTRNAFMGRLYAYDHYDKPGCFVKGTGKGYEADLRLKVSDCGIKKKPENYGYLFTGTVLLQFHPNAVTKNDQLLNISCKYYDDTVRNRIGELMAKMPQSCHYRLRKGSPTGCVMLEGRVGEHMYHTWDCDSDPSQYGFLVHNCFVEGNLGEKIELSDNKGCPSDDSLFDIPQYLEDNTAVMSTSAWRLPMSNYLRYTCKISICDKASGNCDHVVPPQCRRRTKRQIPISNLPTFTVSTRWVTILDSELSIPVEPIKYCSSVF